MTTPKSKTASGPTPVDSITHANKRANLPTADNQDFVSPEVERPVPVRYPRDPSLDPQLVWKGKDELDGQDLVADAPALYIQEKINPQVLVENLRDTAAQREDEPEFTLFDDFDGLPALDQIEFYQHESNWSNRMILGDSLNVMASLAEREALRGKVQMIYLDPPYGIKFGSNWQVSTRNRDVKDGRLESASREVEQIKAFRDTWELGIHSYLSYLRDRLTVAKDLLTDSGSVFVQIGDDNVHLVRTLMEEVFGAENFVSMISFNKSSGLGSVLLPTANDYIIWFARDKRQVKFRQLYLTKSGLADGVGRYTSVHTPDGTVRTATAKERVGDLAPDCHLCTVSDLTKPGPGSQFDIEFEGRTYRPEPRWWGFRPEGFEKLRIARRIVKTGRGISYVRRLNDFPAFPINNVWPSIGGIMSRSDPKIYVVQTSTAAISRCLLMSTDPGDLVLDPTCGSGTTAFVAEQWGRRWMTIDTSRVALALARQRLVGAQFPYYLLADSVPGRAKEEQVAGAKMPAAEVSNDIQHGFVYERLVHVTLKSIANNPDIHEGMSAREIDSVVGRHADTQLLYDKPFEDPGTVRVCGPFTVESLSPHRSLAFAGSAVDGTGGINVEEGSDASNGDASFEQTILANLRVAGIQNGRKGERLHFDSLEPYPATYIQAVGLRDHAEAGTPTRVGVTIGPQYGTVGPAYVKDAAREANKAADLDLLCILAFAFDPAVLGQTADYVASDDGFANVAAERKLGRVPVLLVRMNADLVMGEELKKTGAGNLFTVFGEPDIEIAVEGDELRVILHGVDVYDPNTGELRSSDTSQIALWMIDTAYNEESFFVRHCYFTGGQDPYARLKRALKADIDEEGWASLYRTESRAFPRPESGKIAVKVINDYGDEVVKVFSV